MPEPASGAEPAAAPPNSPAYGSWLQGEAKLAANTEVDI
jgi:hypothetical protein